MNIKTKPKLKHLIALIEENDQKQGQLTLYIYGDSNNCKILGKAKFSAI
jgi:hypothetical protein